MYTYVAIFSFLHPSCCTYVYMLRARLYYTRARLYYDTCPSLHNHGSSLQPADRPIEQYDNATHASNGWVPTMSYFLACEHVAGGA